MMNLIGKRRILGHFAPKCFATSTFSVQSLHEEMHARKVAPSTLFYFLNYRIMPSQVKSTGPRGHLTKEDVVTFIHDHKLSPQKIEEHFIAPE